MNLGMAVPLLIVFGFFGFIMFLVWVDYLSTKQISKDALKAVKYAKEKETKLK